MTVPFMPCPRCEGEGYTFVVYGQLDTYEECELCDGTGDRFGRGDTKATPVTASDEERKR